jgi:cation-transporting ATPase E
VTYDVDGLTTAEVNERLAAGLVNTQKMDPSRSLASILRGNIVNLFNGVVGSCFLLILAVGQWKDSLFGFALITNLLIGIIQEVSAKRTLDRLALLNQPLARVRRDGHDIDIRLELVVLDDLLVLRAGDQILADGEVISSTGLEVDESLLTGESEAVVKVVGDAVLSGCGVIAGSALVHITAVGLNTYASRITVEARRFSLVNSELRNSLNRLIRWVTFALVPLMLIIINGQVQTVGGWGAISNEGWVDVIVKSTSSIVAMVPQGLVLITSIAFALAAVKLTRRRVLLQELYAVEGLARVDILCCDKTGTITDGEIAFDAFHEIERPPVGAQSAVVVLGLFAHDVSANTTTAALRGAFDLIPVPIDASVAFSSVRKWSALTTGRHTWIFGAPDIVFDSSQLHAVARSRAMEYAENGLRTLALAVSVDGVATEKSLPPNLQPVALVTFSEQVRDDARETLAYFHEQGVDIRIISGDNPATVAAVARRAGLEVGEAVDARTLPTEIEALAEILENHRVFGRVTPEQKKFMMEALQSRGHVVAMVGDGVNDALALKHADLGIAMGSGAAATKAVSNLILLDGRFSSLPGVVDEGRKVIANIERLSRLFLTKTVWAMILAAVFGLTLMSFPFLPRQLSAIDSFTIGVPAFLLALLPNSRRYVPGFLRRALLFCVPAGIISAASVLAVNFVIQTDGTWTLAESQTAIALLLGMTGLWVLTTLSIPLTPPRIGILAAMAVLASGIFLIRPFAEFFGFATLSGDQLMFVVLAGLAANAVIAVVARVVDLRIGTAAIQPPRP